MSEFSVSKHIRSLEREMEREAMRADKALSAGVEPEPEPAPVKKRGPGRPKKVKASEPLVEAVIPIKFAETKGPA